MTAPEYDPEVDSALATALRPDSERDLGKELFEEIRRHGHPTDHHMQRAFDAYDIARPIFSKMIECGAVETPHTEMETNCCFRAGAVIATLALPPENDAVVVAATLLAIMVGDMEDEVALTKKAIDNVRKGLHTRGAK